MAYVGSKAEIASNLNRLSSRAGVPKWVLTYEAQKRGWTRVGASRPWTSAEAGRLKEKLDQVPITGIAGELDRSVISTQAKAAEVRLLARVADAYSVSDLAECFGVRQARVESWVRRGFLGKPQRIEGRSENLEFATASVARFIKQYAREYDLSRVHQAWFKAVVFGCLGEARDRP